MKEKILGFFVYFSILLFIWYAPLFLFWWPAHKDPAQRKLDLIIRTLLFVPFLILSLIELKKTFKQTNQRFYRKGTLSNRPSLNSKELNSRPLLHHRNLTPIFDIPPSSFLSNQSEKEPVNALLPLSPDELLIAIGETIFSFQISTNILSHKFKLGRGKVQYIWRVNNFLVVQTDSSVEVFNITSSQSLWFKPLEELEEFGGAYTFKKGVIVGGKRGSKGYLKLLKLESGEEIWHKDFPFIISGAIGEGERIYAGGRKKLLCLDALNGEELWSLDGDFESSAMVADEENLYLGLTKGEVVKVEANRGTVGWRTKINSNEIADIQPYENGIMVLTAGRKISLLDEGGNEIAHWYLEEAFKKKGIAKNFFFLQSKKARNAIYVLYFDPETEEGIAVLATFGEMKLKTTLLAFQCGLIEIAGDEENIYLGYSNGRVKAYKISELSRKRLGEG